MSGAPERPQPDDSGIEALLREVGARTEPDSGAARQVEAAVHAEWQAMLQQRQLTRRRVIYGAAASIAVAAVATTFGLRMIAPPPAQLAKVERVSGVLLAGAADGQLQRRESGSALTAGEILRTDDRSRAALSLDSGLSLRMDHGTVVALTARDRVELRAGAVYVDAPLDAVHGRDLVVQSGIFEVRHVGTQYSVRGTTADSESAVEVGVREGRVTVTNQGQTRAAAAGELVRLNAAGQVQRQSLAPHDVSWQWTSSVAPAFDIDQRPLADFLEWVARETGQRVAYASAQARAAAESAILHGSIVGLTPQDALDTVLPTTQLRRAAADDATLLIDVQSSGSLPSNP